MGAKVKVLKKVVKCEQEGFFLVTHTMSFYRFWSDTIYGATNFFSIVSPAPDPLL
jgi:hypothetical protein